MDRGVAVANELADAPLVDAVLLGRERTLSGRIDQSLRRATREMSYITVRRALVGPLAMRETSSYADRPCHAGVLLGEHAVADDRHRRADRELAVELDGEGVHRDRPGDAAALAGDTHLRAGQVAAEAVRVADRDDADPRGGRHVRAAVAGALPGRSSFTCAR